MNYGGDNKAIKYLFEGHRYSTTKEIFIGAWVNGNIAYEKVIQDTDTHISNFTKTLPTYTDFISLEVYVTVGGKIKPLTDYEVDGTTLTITNSETITATTIIFKYTKEVQE